jgi:hypothetical protein
MRRTALTLAAAAALMLALAAPAAAHVLVVTPPNADEPVSTHRGGPFEEIKAMGDVGWVGGGPLPGQGQGLISSPAGTLSPAHAKGLNTACEQNGSSVVAIFGPPSPAGCPHGT